MKLESYINDSIMRYPTLYRSDNHSQSRKLVLDHIFLSYGTGFEWHKDGFLAPYSCDDKGNEFYVTEVKYPELPKNFYDMDLWYMDIKNENLNKIKKELENRFYYTRPPFNGDIEIIFESDEKTATVLMEKYELIPKHVAEMRARWKEFSKKEYIAKPSAAISYWHTKSTRAPKEFIRTPSDMCKYSPLVEMVNGRTNSPHIENFDLKHIQKDWVDGAIEIAKDTLEFYKDSEKCKAHSWNPSKTLNNTRKIYEENPLKYIKDFEPEGMTANTKIEDWCEIRWQKHRKEQMKYCQDFLNKFDINKP